MQGWRTGMEDSHLCIPSLTGPGNWKGVGLFGVFDGHGGEQVAKFSKRHIAEELVNFPLPSPQSWNYRRDLEVALTSSFHRIDELLVGPNASEELRSLTNRPFSPIPKNVDASFVGCTACVVAITRSEIVVANSGDSRAVLCRGGKTVQLSTDHKPNLPQEWRRIYQGGGFVESMPYNQHRVNGNLNLSRALGDLDYKKDKSKGPESQIISATPEIQRVVRTPEDEFVIICCDGVWDVKSNEEVVDFMHAQDGSALEATNEELEKVLERLLDSCLSNDLRKTKGLGGDNMTAVFIRLNQTTSFDPIQSFNLSPTSSLHAGVYGELAFAEPALAMSIHAKVAVDKNAGTKGPAETGVIVMSFALPKGCRACDIAMRINKVLPAVEVAVAAVPGRSRLAEVFSFAGHLPVGARFSDADPLVLKPAKFFSRSAKLKATLSWETK